jgi:hypothetical protein
MFQRTRHSGLCFHSVQEINMGIYHITITTLDASARAPFLIQSRAPFGVLDYRYAMSVSEALRIAEWMREWHAGKFTTAPISWIGR